MVNIILAGALGKMGRTITRCAQGSDKVRIVAGVDVAEDPAYDPGFPIYPDFSSIAEEADVVVDFSSPALLGSLLDFCLRKKVAAVIAATGYGDAERSEIRSASQQLPVFFSANMSVGINLLRYLAREAARIIGLSSDIEIVERHHNQKVDAPSGTALALADSINEVLDDAYSYQYDRTKDRKKREKYEIGIQAVRGGSIVGEHEVIFAGMDEVIEFKHTAYSKAVFGKGAVEAAKFLAGKPAGRYDMSDLT